MWLWFSQWIGMNSFGCSLGCRIVLATFTSLIIALTLGNKVITLLRHYHIGQSVRTDGPQTHLTKMGTPTMGGIFILIAILVSTLIWGDLSNCYLWFSLLVLLSFSVIGGIDDYYKLTLKNSQGLSAKQKYLWQTLVSLSLASILYYLTDFSGTTQLSVLSKISLGWFYIPWVYLVITGTSNAVNLTDGLDGLAIVPIMLVATALGIIAWLTGAWADALKLTYLPTVSELTPLIGSIVGAGLGFLWFNAYPAQVFMGDIGSLSLGALLGSLAVILHQELLLIILGGLFVIEALSVICQVICFKLTGRRILRMAPLHHHFELQGWPETQVIVRFWILSILLGLGGLSLFLSNSVFF